MLGDWLVVSQVLPVNPAAAVRGPKHVVTKVDAVHMCGTTACEVVASFASCLGVAYSSPTQGQGVLDVAGGGASPAAACGAGRHRCHRNGLDQVTEPVTCLYFSNR